MARMPIHRTDDRCVAALPPAHGPPSLAISLRWEVLERFYEAVWPPAPLQSCVKALSRMDRELQANGGKDVEALCSQFQGPDHAEMTAPIEDWQDLHDPATGQLTQALRQEDLAEFRSGLGETRLLNKRFLQMSYPLLESRLRSPP